tara:strand:- start:1097 stop:2863 length:1767 start_codon:yes stop_codon:yes gene_type:complete
MTTKTKNALVRPGEIEIGSVRLICDNGFSIDLKEIMVELTLNEDLYSPFVYGEVSIVDTLSLVKNAPIIGGEETLLIEYNLPCTEAVKNVYRVYKIKDRQRTDRDSTEVYTLCFASPELEKNNDIEITGTFSGKYSEIARQLYSEYFAIPDVTPPINISESANFVRFTANRWTPIETFNYMANRAVSASNENEMGFLFFRRMDSYNFINIFDQFDQEPIVIYRRINRSLALPENKYDLLIEQFNIEDYTIINTHDSIQNRLEGEFDSVTTLYDITSKQVTESYFSYSDDFNRTRSIEPYPLISDFRQDINTTEQPRRSRQLRSLEQRASYSFDSIEDNLYGTISEKTNSETDYREIGSSSEKSISQLPTNSVPMSGDIVSPFTSPSSEFGGNINDEIRGLVDINGPSVSDESMNAWFTEGEIRPDLERYAEEYGGFYIEREEVPSIEGVGGVAFIYTIQPPLGTEKKLPEQKQTTVGEDQPKQPKNNIPTTQELPLKRRSQLKSLNGQLIEITVPGDSRRRVGEIIEVDIPSYESRFTEDGTDHSVSGRYMISHIKHVIKKDDYKLVMELSRNSRKQKLPENNEIIEE